MTEQAFTDDTLFDGRVLLRQPAEGYRISIDTILLQAAVQPKAGESVLDVGTGVGGAALCLAIRCPEIKVTGLEVQWDYMKLATENVDFNKVRDRVEMVYGDLQNPPPRLAAGTFTHVMANPPYLDAARSRVSDHQAKRLAMAEGQTSLQDWVRFCLLMTKPKGTVTFIHRADRLDELLSALVGKVGDIAVFPLWPFEGKPAKRVIIQAKKNSQAPLRLLSGLVLHQEDGQYTPQTTAILRDGTPLVLG